MLLGADRTEAAGSGSQPGRASGDGDLRAIPESRDGLITHCETETALFSDRIGVAEATSAAPGVEDRAPDLTRLLQPNEGRLRAGVSHGAVSWYADSKCSWLIALITFGPDHRPSDACPGCVKDTGSLGRTPYFLCLARPNGHPPKVTAISIAWNIRAILLPFLARVQIGHRSSQKSGSNMIRLLINGKIGADGTEDSADSPDWLTIV